MLNAEWRGLTTAPLCLAPSIQNSELSIQQFSITEKEDQIDPCPFNSPLVDAIGGTGRLGRRVRVQAKKPRNLELHLELCGAAVAKLLIQLDERALIHLLPQRDRRAQIAILRCRRDLEEVDVQRFADRFAERRRDESGRNAARGGRQRRTLARAKLVDR